ncbi:hypothetical protein DB346_19930 [Verrucomicrobia bacterium LW23]|nr:hypothetical protein DB346_19930 [Verrucomicrobia bacterium LW23]
MKKIISLFKRNYDTDHLVRNEVVPGAEWVLAGEGVATRKWDGSCCLVQGGALFKRYEVARGKAAPANFTPAGETDPVTGKTQGWVAVDAANPSDRYFCEAIAAGMPADGTYELVGPKVQGNPDAFGSHQLVRHGALVLEGVPRDFDGLKAWLRTAGMEGVVWHHPDGRMVKIKAKDFARSGRVAAPITAA